jgi:hypothetical protein
MLPITLHIDELDWGTPFVLGLVGCLAFYAGGGIMYGRHRGGAAANHKGVDTWKAHPHAKQLEEFGGLVLDGYTFTSVRLAGKRGYKPVDREVRSSKGETGDLESGSKREKRRSSHVSTSSSKSPKTSSSKEKQKKHKSEKNKKAERRSSDASGSKANTVSPRKDTAASAPEDAKGNNGGAVGKDPFADLPVRRLCATASLPNLELFACVGAGGFGGVLQEERVGDNVHSSQAKIKVVGLNG